MSEQHSDLSDDINVPDDDMQSMETGSVFSQIQTLLHTHLNAVPDSQLFTSKKSTEQFIDKVYYTHLSLYFSTDAEKYNRILLPVSEIKKRFNESIKNKDNIQYKIDDEQTNSKNFEKLCNFLKEFNFKIKKAISKRNEHLKLKRLNTSSNNVQQQHQQEPRQQTLAEQHHRRSMEDVAKLRQELEIIFNKKLGG